MKPRLTLNHELALSSFQTTGPWKPTCYFQWLSQLMYFWNISNTPQAAWPKPPLTWMLVLQNPDYLLRCPHHLPHPVQLWMFQQKSLFPQQVRTLCLMKILLCHLVSHPFPLLQMVMVEQHSGCLLHCLECA